MTDTAVPPPQPLPDPDSRGFWQATSEGRLALCRCTGPCRSWLQPPLERCPVCASPTAYEDVSGGGTVYSYTVVHHAMVPGFDLPYVVALVELDEQVGLRLIGRLEAGAPPKIGDRVQAHIAPLAGGPHHVPIFRPASSK